MRVVYETEPERQNHIKTGDLVRIKEHIAMPSLISGEITIVGEIAIVTEGPPDTLPDVYSVWTPRCQTARGFYIAAWNLQKIA